MIITVITKEKEYLYESSEPILLSEVLRRLGIPISLPCAGTGRCGKCKVRATGEISPPNAMELAHLSEAELKAGIRLLCRTAALGNAIIHYTQEDLQMQGVTEGKSSNGFHVSAPYQNGAGLAFDIGTTTVAGYLYEFPSGKQTASLLRENRQRAHGADVISRMSYAIGGGKDLLQSEIVGELKEMESELAGDKEVQARVVTGNTAMLSFYLGVDTEGMSRAPFEPGSLFGYWQGNTYFPRSMDAFVGADITTAILAADLLRHKSALLLDIGTNGEMALWHEGQLTACSTAAGPAFEGVGIEQGMEAKKGAVSKVDLTPSGLIYETVHHAPPIGICGTGVMDAVAALLERGDVDETGYMETRAKIAPGVYLTPEDVRQVQLAKAAISAGIRVLLYEAGISAADLDACYIAGGFGSFIRPETATRIGLIPFEAKNLITPIGNGAGVGAGILLLDPTRIPEAEEVAKSAHTLNLADHPRFSDYYMEEMMFPCDKG